MVKCFVRETNHPFVRHAILLSFLVVLLSGAASMSLATGPSGTLSADCRADSVKLQLPEDLCALFLERLAAAYPDRTVTLAETGAGPADLRRVVVRAAGGLIAARIERTGHTSGPTLGAGRRGAPLDRTALARFLDGLIAVMPQI